MLSDAKQKPGMYQDGLYPPPNLNPALRRCISITQNIPLTTCRLNVGK
jgi:hypothetical protein